MPRRLPTTAPLSVAFYERPVFRCGQALNQSPESSLMVNEPSPEVVAVE